MNVINKFSILTLIFLMALPEISKAGGCQTPQMDGQIWRHGQAFIGTLTSSSFGTSASYLWCADRGQILNNLTNNGINSTPHRCPQNSFSTPLNASTFIPGSGNIPNNWTKGWRLNCPKWENPY